MTQRLKKDRLRCPNCGSHNTQTLPMFYSTSSRYFRSNDREGMAPELQPPKPRSTHLVPIAWATVTWLITLLYLLDGSFSSFAAHMPTGWITTVSGLKALATGGLVLALLWYRAERYNQTVFRAKAAEWWDSAICRRCGCTFSVKTGKTVDLTGDRS